MAPHDGADVAIGRKMIERLIPHRHPSLLLDSIDRMDLGGARLRARRRIDREDAAFDGHFPGDPVFPGVLQIEMIGQAACCLAASMAAGTSDPREIEVPIRIRATRIHRAVMYGSLQPGDMADIFAMIIERDDLLTTALGQVFVGERLCSVCLLEAYVLD